MSFEINADFEQGQLLPHYLDDKIPEDHPARYIRDFVFSLDLKGLGFRAPRESSAGRPSYTDDSGLWILFTGRTDES